MAGTEGDGRLILGWEDFGSHALFSSLLLSFDFENLNERWIKVSRIVAICISTAYLLFAFLSPV